MLFLRRPRKPLAAFRTLARRAWLGTERGARDMVYLPSTVRHPALDALGFGFRQHRGAAQIAGTSRGIVDQPVALADLVGLDLAIRSEFEALFGARLGLHFGHF